MTSEQKIPSPKVSNKWAVAALSAALAAIALWILAGIISRADGVIATSLLVLSLLPDLLAIIFGIVGIINSFKLAGKKGLVMSIISIPLSPVSFIVFVQIMPLST